MQSELGDLSRALSTAGIDAEVLTRHEERHNRTHVVTPTSSAPDVQVSETHTEQSFDDRSPKHGNDDGQQRRGSRDSKPDEEDEPNFISHMRSYRWLAP
jgi:hypothetical protein